MDDAVQAYLHALTRRGPHERVGPFVVGLDAHSANPFRNYAVPGPGAEPSAADVDALVALFTARGRRPRLEYVPSCAPLVEPALLAAGFAVESRAPIMACPAGPPVEMPPPPGVELVEATGDDDLLTTAQVQHDAYGEPEPPTEADVARLRRTLERGGVVVLARTASGTGAGAGLCTAPLDGVCELAAVAVPAAFRRRGIAAAVTARLAALARTRGATTVWLEPAGAAQQRVYERVGFSPAGWKVALAR